MGNIIITGLAGLGEKELEKHIIPVTSNQENEIRSWTPEKLELYFGQHYLYEKHPNATNSQSGFVPDPIVRDVRIETV